MQGVSDDLAIAEKWGAFSFQNAALVDAMGRTPVSLAS